MKIFFDLENTLIHHWTNRSLCHQNNIKAIIECYKNFQVSYGIYSYALWCDNNIEEFKNEILPDIEKYYNITIDHNLIIHVNEMCQASVFNHHALTECDIGSHCKFYNKEHSFKDWVNVQEDDRYVLVDDTVTNSSRCFFNDKEILFLNPLNKH